MIDFDPIRGKSDEEVTAWGIEKWTEYIKSEWRLDPDARPYVRTFARYIGEPHIPDFMTREWQ